MRRLGLPESESADDYRLNVIRSRPVPARPPVAVALVRRGFRTVEAARAVGAGVRAQAVSANGALVDDFVIKQGRNAIHILNAPSPGATLLAQRSERSRSAS